MSSDFNPITSPSGQDIGPVELRVLDFLSLFGNVNSRFIERAVFSKYADPRDRRKYYIKKMVKKGLVVRNLSKKPTNIQITKKGLAILLIMGYEPELKSCDLEKLDSVKWLCSIVFGELQVSSTHVNARRSVVRQESKGLLSRGLLLKKNNGKKILLGIVQKHDEINITAFNSLSMEEDVDKIIILNTFSFNRKKDDPSPNSKVQLLDGRSPNSSHQVIWELENHFNTPSIEKRGQWQ